MAVSIRWIAAVLLTSALAACASASPRAPTVATAAAAAPQLVHISGSVIAVPVDPRTGVPQTAAPMQIVTKEELDRSGYVRLGSALRELVPQLQ